MTNNLEDAQNSEPNIAVNPVDPTQIMISAFGSAQPEKFFLSKDGGATWGKFPGVSASDASLAWSGNGKVYLARLSGSGTAMCVFKQRSPTLPGAVFVPIAASNYVPGGEGPDQPWIETATVAGRDRIYVAFNDLSQPVKTASVRFSLDSGATWQNTIIERTNPPDNQDGSAVRIKALGERVYAAFQRFNAVDANGNESGDIVVVRDDAGGTGKFKALGTNGVGVIAAANESLPQNRLGSERLGSDLSIAIDPSNSSRVAVAFAAISGGGPVVVVRLSTNAGATWQEVHTTPASSALPAVAIAANGTIALLYTKYDGTNIETHLIQSANNFSTSVDETLSRFANASLPVEFQPFIGDYEDLVAVENTFYGTFSASNDVNAFSITPVMLRDKTMLGNGVPFSIDPFFFKSPALLP